MDVCSEGEIHDGMDQSFENENRNENDGMRHEEEIENADIGVENMPSRDDVNRNDEGSAERVDVNEEMEVSEESSNDSEDDSEDDFDVDPDGDPDGDPDRDSDVDSDDDLNGDSDDEFERPERPIFQGFDENFRMNVNLQNDINVRAKDILLTCLARNVRHKGTYESLISDFQCSKDLYIECNLPTTKEKLWKVLKRDRSNLMYSVYCTLCNDKIGDGKKPTKDCHCGDCGPGKDKDNLGTFILPLLVPQLHDFFKLPNIAASLRYKYERVKINHDNKEDIYDGERYVKLSQEGRFLNNPYNYSFTLWVDGVSLAKSSNASVTPILLQINELPPHARNKHVLLAGIYVGKKKPNVTSLLLPIVKQLRHLEEEGIKWHPEGPDGPEVESKFTTLIFTADAVAKAEGLRMCPHNSYYGCPKCYIQGFWDNTKIIFPNEEIILRKHNEILQCMEIVFQDKEPFLGVRGCNAFASLRHFDLAEGPIHDDVHGYFLGCAKQITTHILEDVGKEWYIGQKKIMKKIDKKLKKIQLPSRVCRQARSICTFHKWKASEWRNWLFYYALPCLEDILKEPYFTNLRLLSESVFILNNVSISERDLNLAQTLLRQFVATSDIYGNANMTYNVHTAEHGPNSVKSWGPSWAYSTFPFESFGAKIKDDVKSPHDRADQIVDRFFLRKFVESSINADDIAEKTKRRVRKLLEIKDEPIPQNMSPGHYYVGIGKERQRYPSELLLRLIREAEEVIDENTLVHIHKQAKIHGVKYRKHDIVKRKFCDSIAYNGKDFFSIMTFLSYRNGERTVSGLIGKQFQVIENLYGTEHIRRVLPSETLRFVSYHDITVPATVFCIKKKYYAIPLSNISTVD
ncbi:uncharacterized protein LOC122512314 [Leptopilina heterotoma]|uniref:uncharacterized protein LOC122512314 n=1 Tax=Leptopilina heterotoma TaxID=63436 RepID=UPI001CAA19BC|nr:uncharacterized protein LOC122512314 [Leptopilina heterotoma]XP_043484008.1 uncharacterized protein LOC122512314 [Leptopilina heterotoma]